MNDILERLDNVTIQDGGEALLAGADTNMTMRTYDPPAAIKVTNTDEGDGDQRMRIIDVFFYRDMNKILVWSLPFANWVFDHDPLLGIFGLRRRRQQSEKTENKIKEWVVKLADKIK